MNKTTIFKTALFKNMNIFRTNIPVFIAIAIYLPVFTAIYTAVMKSFYQQYYHQSISIADCLLFQNHGYMVGLFIIPVFVLLVQVMLRHAFEINLMIRQKSRRKIWLGHVQKIGVCAGVFSIYYCVCALCIGSIFSEHMMNWNVKESIFFLATESVTNIPFVLVIVMFILSTCFVLFCYGLLFLITWWFIKNPIVSWVIVTAFIVWDIFMGDFSIIQKRASIGYQRWIANDYWIGFLIVFGICVLIFVIGLLLANRKEFYHANHTA